MNKTSLIIRPNAGSETTVLAEPGKTVYIFFIDHQSDSEINLEFFLRAEGAELDLIGFDLGSSHAVTIRSAVIHDQPYTTSHTYVKSLLGGDAQSIYKGIIHLQKSAQNASASFEHRTLLLSPDARGQAEPILEIEANQVQAKHAATISTLDPLNIYYLRSRGLDNKQAAQTLTQGFLMDTLSHVPPKSRLQIQKYIETSLQTLSFAA